MKKESSISGFGKRLATTRRAKGLTQDELGDKVGVSRRVIAYYECQSKHPPTHLLLPLAKALKINPEELLGLKKSQISDSNHAALWRRLKKAETLSKRDQQALLHYLDALLTKSKVKK